MVDGGDLVGVRLSGLVSLGAFDGISKIFGGADLIDPELFDEDELEAALLGIC